MGQAADDAKHVSGNSRRPPMSSAADCEREGEGGGSLVNMSCMVLSLVLEVELQLEGRVGETTGRSSAVSALDSAAS